MAIKRADRDKVEDGKTNIGDDKGNEENTEAVGEEVDGEGNDAGQKQVAYRASDGDEANVTSGVGEIVGVKGSGFAPAKGKTATRKEHKS